MPTTIKTQAIEQGSVTFVATITDEDGAALIPTTLTWTLTDLEGNVINSREDVALSPAATVNITLTGNDLAIGTNGTKRALLIEGTYTSTYGVGLPLKEECIFSLYDLKGVS